MTSNPVKVPDQPENTFRVTLDLLTGRPRLDQVLLEALRQQKRNLRLRSISRTDFKELFKKKRVRIKGQPATPSSALAAGITHVDIHGFSDTAQDSDSSAEN